jgi:hypothetical protein
LFSRFKKEGAIKIAEWGDVADSSIAFSDSATLPYNNS